MLARWEKPPSVRRRGATTAREKPKNRFKEKERGRPSSSHHRSLAFLFLCFGDIFKNQTDTFSRRHIKKRREEPTPYALAAAVTADESGAIDPGDNPVAFFTQLSDAFLFEPLPEDILTPLLFFCCFDDAFFRFCRQNLSKNFVCCCWGAFETEKKFLVMKFAFLPPS